MSNSGAAASGSAPMAGTAMVVASRPARARVPSKRCLLRCGRPCWGASKGGWWVTARSFRAGEWQDVFLGALPRIVRAWRGRVKMCGRGN
ncbi:hypothetical protein GCM10028832_15320 [Streptomyces sparsus]